MNSLKQRRQQARYLLLQALYQQSMSHHDHAELCAQFADKYAADDVDSDYFLDLIDHICHHHSRLEHAFEPYLDRPIGRLDPVTRAILKLATAELIHRLDVPYAVVIHEALLLAKRFGATESHRFINGILDKMASDLRQHEHPSA